MVWKIHLIIYPKSAFFFKSFFYTVSPKINSFEINIDICIIITFLNISNEKKKDTEQRICTYLNQLSSLSPSEWSEK